MQQNIALIQLWNQNDMLENSPTILWLKASHVSLIISPLINVVFLCIV